MSNSKGIPTIGVRGIQFRSRIEAQWAYIFENLEWNWEYEPLDLDGYIPDFIINFYDSEILIEIKGDTNIWENYEEHKNKIIKSGWKKPFAILGSRYKISEYWDDNNCPNIGKVSYIPQEDGKWITDDLIIRKEKDRYNKNGKPEWFLGGDYILYDICSGDWKNIIETKTDFDKLWVEAKNKVQWKGIQNKIDVIPNKKTLEKIIENTHKNETVIKYDGLTVEESQYFFEKGGISKFIDETFEIMMSNIKNIKDILIHTLINQDDKKRIMTCYEKIKIYYEINNELPIWGNIDIFIDNKVYIYKVNYDKSLQHLQSKDIKNYKK
jgi:hypothetical protein